MVLGVCYLNVIIKSDIQLINDFGSQPVFTVI